MVRVGSVKLRKDATQSHEGPDEHRHGHNHEIEITINGKPYRIREGVTTVEHLKRLADIGVTLHALTTWHDVLAVAKASGKFEPKMLAEVEKFINDPAGWSKAHGGVATAAE